MLRNGVRRGGILLNWRSLKTVIGLAWVAAACPRPPCALPNAHIGCALIYYEAAARVRAGVNGILA